MPKPTLLDVYELPGVSNVCHQILREVISLSNVSMAHVIMNESNVSLWHKHSKMTEVYFILNGNGIFYHGNEALLVETGAYIVLPPNTPHKLRNTGEYSLEHLVFAIPPFDSSDVEILDEDITEDINPKKFNCNKPPITALDGALIYELMSAEERKGLDVALAFGSLPPRRKAIPHYHRISEEIYYVTNGLGKVMVGEQTFEVKKGSVVYVPTNRVHALENRSDSEELRILCVSSPSYTEEDFLKVP